MSWLRYTNHVVLVPFIIAALLLMVVELTLWHMRPSARRLRAIRRIQRPGSLISKRERMDEHRRLEGDANITVVGNGRYTREMAERRRKQRERPAP